MKENGAPEAAAFAQSSADGRFVSLGPYYAMFPVGFVVEAMERFCPEGASVLDPFCGRGTVPFVAAVRGHQSYGFDINPVAWVYAETKANPAPIDKVLIRLSEVASAILPGDEVPENDFQANCWHPKFLSFLRSARRELKWETNQVDRSLMAFILVVLHAKSGNGLSNQMRQSKAMSPDYSVRWWKRQESIAPDLDAVEYLTKRIQWRYAKGMPTASGRAKLVYGDSVRTLETTKMPPIKFVLTSPPYSGVTDYRYDNWIRLWMLGDTPLPTSQGKALKYASEERYKTMMSKVFEGVKKVCAPDVVLVVRTDMRRFTLATTCSVLKGLWPEHSMIAKHEFQRRTQTSLFHRDIKRVGEVDIIVSPKSLDLGRHAEGYGSYERILDVAA